MWYDNTIYESEAIFIAVGTPQGNNGNADLQYILKPLLMPLLNMPIQIAYLLLNLPYHQELVKS